MILFGSLLLFFVAVSYKGEWRMANGEWRMANGEWRMANGYFANGKWRMATLRLKI
jgi:hypothetical protein